MCALATCAPAEPDLAERARPAHTQPRQDPASAPEAAVWRYTPALVASLPPGVRAEPVLELADGLHGRARIVVAVAKDDVPARLEVWDYSQNNERGLLERVSQSPLLDLADADAPLNSEAVAALRRDVASPGNEIVRPLGLPGEAAALPAELARLAAEATGTADAATRTTALARLIRGLDDHLVWETARLPELLRRLRAGAWQLGEARPLGARRVKISATEAGRAIELELARTQDRWALTDVRDAQSSTAPAAEPSPTAP
jgi:hypothetical protein